MNNLHIKFLFLFLFFGQTNFAQTAKDWFEKGGKAYDNKQYENAIECYTKAIKLGYLPMRLAFNNRANAQQNLGKHAEAIADYDVIIRFDPNDAFAYNNRGFSKKELGDHTGAIVDFDKSILLDPNNILAISNRKEALEKLATSAPKKTKNKNPNEDIISQSGNKSTPNIYAFIVGIENYRSSFRALDYATDDAYYLQQYLTSTDGMALSSQNVRIITDTKATKSNILLELQKQSDLANENDLFIFFFSGHGTEGYYVPFDNEGTKESSLLAHKEISYILKRCKAKNKLILADACFSGDAGKASSSEIQKKYYKDMLDSKGSMSMMSSSKSNEMSLEADGYQHGYFTYNLVEGMKGAADDDENGIVTLGELYNYVSYNVKKGTNYKQNPTISDGYDEKMPVVMVKK